MNNDRFRACLILPNPPDIRNTLRLWREKLRNSDVKQPSYQWMVNINNDVIIAISSDRKLVLDVGVMSLIKLGASLLAYGKQDVHNILSKVKRIEERAGRRSFGTSRRYYGEQ